MDAAELMKYHSASFANIAYFVGLLGLLEVFELLAGEAGLLVTACLCLLSCFVTSPSSNIAGASEPLNPLHYPAE